MRFLKIKNAAIREYNNDTALAKQQVTTSYAGMSVRASGSVYLPKKLIAMNVTVVDLLNALEDIQDLDPDSKKCAKFIWLLYEKIL